MHFGVQWSHRNPPGWGRSTTDLYRDVLEEVRHAEELGFESAWVTEHHFTDDGYLPSVMPMLGAFAAATTRIRLGSYVLLMPLHHPVRLAEDAAVIDQLSDGRLEMAIASGYRAEEFAGLGVDRATRGPVTAEAVAVMLACWADGQVDHQGDRFTFQGFEVTPKPVQRPTIPIYLGGMATPVLRRAARLPIAGLAGRPAPDQMEEYARLLEEHGQTLADRLFITSRFLWVSPSTQQAWAESRRAAEWIVGHYGDWFGAAGSGKWQGAVEDECIIGSPAYVTERLHEFIELAPHAPLHRLILHPPLLGIDHAASMRMLETFASEVAPHFSHHAAMSEPTHGSDRMSSVDGSGVRG